MKPINYLVKEENMYKVSQNLGTPCKSLLTVLTEKVDILFWSISPTNSGQFSKPETDLKSAGPDVFKTPPTCTI